MRSEPARAAARLFDGDHPVATLVTLVRPHWDRVGPATHPCHVNPTDRTVWCVRFDDDRSCVFSDEVELDIPADDQWREGHFTVGGRRLRLEWLPDDVGTDACEREGW